IITADANGNIWFSESNSGKIGRLSGNEICEYTTPGLSNPQQIVTVGSGDQLQVVFTEGNGNSVSVLTQAEADQASFPNRVCTIVAAQTFSTPVVKVIARMFDEEVSPLRTAIVPTVHQVTPVGGSGIQRFSPMPNPLLSVDGTPIGDAGYGFPSGLTGWKSTGRAATGSTSSRFRLPRVPMIRASVQIHRARRLIHIAAVAPGATTASAVTRWSGRSPMPGSRVRATPRGS